MLLMSWEWFGKVLATPDLNQARSCCNHLTGQTSPLQAGAILCIVYFSNEVMIPQAALGLMQPVSKWTSASVQSHFYYLYTVATAFKKTEPQTKQLKWAQKQNTTQFDRGSQ